MRIRLAASAALLLTVVPPAFAQSGAGEEAFDATCAHCHGGNGQGAELGPNILPRVLSENDEALAAYLRTGDPARGMPPAPVSDAQMPALVAFLRELAEAGGAQAAAAEDPGNRYASTPRIENYRPVTQAMLLDPDPADWLMYSRTYDAQRFSPLDQINTDNVDSLALAWSLNLPDGITETIPTVYDGVMYLTMPGASVAALDAATGDLIWHYQRDYESERAGGSGRSKTLSIFEDMVYFAAADDTIVALDARTGDVRWEAEVPGRGNTSGSIVVEGKVISGGTCRTRSTCYIAAHDARSGELLWKFHTVQAPGEPPGFDTWAGAPLEERLASTWGLPGGYDAETGLIYWSVANPMPNTRADRHGGDVDAISYSAPADLYSNSTVALNPDSGELAWYYQHLPGDDWDEDMNQERVIINTPVNPDPEHLKWINPDIPRGERRDLVVNVGEGGGIWALDKRDGRFVWATPFPFAPDNFLISDIDERRGTTHINRELILQEPGDQRTICYYNTRSYWPSAYHPGNNSLYVPYIRNCLNMTRAAPATANSPAVRESRLGVPEPGVDLDALNGLAKIDMETGEMEHWVTGRIPTNSSILATAGNLIFWGDINRRFRAMHADTGEVLWETIVGGPISTSNITYAVDGRQYVAVIAGDNLSHPGLNAGGAGPIALNLNNGAGNNAIFVFALPEPGRE